MQVRKRLGVGPGDRVVFESDTRGVRVRTAPAAGPFDKWCGIGNPGIGSGRKAIGRWLRDLRGR